MMASRCSARHRSASPPSPQHPLQREILVFGGKTPVGVATVAALNMNQPLQTVARPLWRQLGLFP
jgi:hypothetical protein